MLVNSDRQIADELQLEAALSEPGEDVVELFGRLDGDLVIPGVAGKIGLSLGAMAVRARDAAGGRQRVYGVARFSDPAARDLAADAGMIPVQADLLDEASLAGLPSARNVLYLAGRKFGTTGAEAQTWAGNVLMPANVCRRYAGSRVVAYSTGCVYPLVDAAGGGSGEDDRPGPVGEYAQSCLGRERVFEYFCERDGTPVCLYRLNYAVDLRYGVLSDIGRRVWNGEPVDLTMARFNVVWQGDANRYALLALERAACPAARLNVTGPEILSTRTVAETFGALLQKPVHFTGQAGEACLLSNASRCHALFGPPRIGAETLIQWQAAWIMQGGRSLGKPTHFEVNNGEF